MKILIALLVSCVVSANELSIDVVPKKPVAGESFNAIFRIATTSDEDPIISFDPQNLEVQGRESRGVSIRTKFINGKLFTEKEVTFSYELIAPNQGYTYLKNIRVKIGGQTITHPKLKIRVYRTPQESKSFFARAEVDKTNIYVGEGTTVKYYLYHKSEVRNFEITAYPKLRKFLKRFYNKPEGRKNVEINGEIYRRTLLYSARVFAERPGDYYIDPVKLKVEYITRKNNDPFGSFGLGLQRLRSKRIRSDRVDIKVKPLPPAPAGIKFSGLVGKHKFKVFQTKNRFLVNEAIEVKLEVTGGGALEAVEAPVLYADNNLEEFETNSDLTVMDDTTARKIYEYTYLARASIDLDPREMKIYYFSPTTQTYEFDTIKLSGLNVIGGAVPVANGQSDSQNSQKRTLEPVLQPQGSQIVGPIINPSFFNQIRFVNFINYSLVGLIILVLLSFFLKARSTIGRREHAVQLDRKLKKGETNYSVLFNLLKLEPGSEKMDLTEFIKSKSLSSETEKYLLDLVESAQSASYYMGERNFSFNYKKKAFRELLNSMDL